jgi:hypothetical protein
MHLQRRLTDGGSLSEVVDLCGPHAASSAHEVPQWDSFGIDADIAGIVSSNTVVSVELKVPGLDEGHAVWCMSDTTCSITPPEENRFYAEFQPFWTKCMRFWQLEFQQGKAPGARVGGLRRVLSGVRNVSRTRARR